MPFSHRYVVDPEHKWVYGNHPDATPAELLALKEVLLANKAAFAYSLKDLAHYKGDLGDVEIQLTTTKPLVTPPRRYSTLESQLRDEKVFELQAAGIVTRLPPGKLLYASAPTMPSKKGPDGKPTDVRFCIDFRSINEHTIPDPHRPPLPETIFAALHASRYFSKLDLRAGFHQLNLHEHSRPVTAFWRDRELFMYNRLPFGLRNATAEFQKRMDKVLLEAGLSHVAMVFVDDVIIHTRTMAEHIIAVRDVLSRLHALGLRVHPEKSYFAAEAVEYLGHLLRPGEMSPMQAKVEAIRALPAPTSVAEWQSQRGLMGYYSGYIPGFSTIASVINDLTRKDVPWQWGPTHQAAFDQLKDALTTPGLALRHPDPDRPFILYTDWCKHGMAAILGQRDDTGLITLLHARHAPSMCTSATMIPARGSCWHWSGGSNTSDPTCMGVISPFALTTARSSGSCTRVSPPASRHAGSCRCRSTTTPYCTALA